MFCLCVPALEEKSSDDDYSDKIKLKQIVWLILSSLYKYSFYLPFFNKIISLNLEIMSPTLFNNQQVNWVNNRGWRKDQNNENLSSQGSSIKL